MASIRIHEDQENRVPELRQKQTMMAVQQKRLALGAIDGNKTRNHNVGGKQKQPLGLHNAKAIPSKTKDDKENAKENLKNLVNPIVPVAQFEAFKVYEDDMDVPRVDNKPKPKSKITIYNDLSDEETEKKEVSEEDDKPDFKNDSLLNLMHMSIDKGFNDSVRSIESTDSTGTSRSRRELFFELPEYRDDIYLYLRQHELKHRAKPGYIKKQPDVTANMRSILVDWLVEVAEEYKLHTETLYLAVNYIDRFLSYMSVVRAKLQLVGTAAMFLASKYEEIYPPDIGEYVYITDDTYNKRQVIRMEQLILKVLGFDLSVPTPLTFITAICIANNLCEKTKNLAMYFCELSMLNGEIYLEFLPSLLASAAIALARHTLNNPVWDDELRVTTGYKLEQLQSGIEFLNMMFITASTNPQHAIQDKYKAQKYLSVSQLTPNENKIKF